MTRFGPLVLLVTACWVVFGVNVLLFHGGLDQFGILPRQSVGLPGIVCAPFLHHSLAHLIANTVPLLILGAMLSAGGAAEFLGVTGLGILLSGALVWLLARPADHLGASGLVFCYFGYLLARAWYRRTFGNLVLGAVCLVAYGGIWRGLIPNGGPVSWESHLAGLLTGIALARAAGPRR